MFKVGDKVICIDTDFKILTIDRQIKTLLQLGKIYEIKKMGQTSVMVDDIRFRFHIKRFMLLSEYRRRKINKILNR